MERKTRLWLGGCSALAVLFVVALVAAALALRSAAVPARSLLVLELTGAIEEQGSASALERLLQGRPDTILGLRALLRSAARDPRVSALLVRVSGLRVGMAKADELREQIRRFQESGKPAAAFLEISDTLDYYVASACKQVYVAPEGLLVLRGVLADAPFLRGTLDKLRIQPDFVAVGRYKTAPETFTRSDMSPAQREVVNALLDQIYARLRDGVAESRGLAPKRVETLIDRAVFRGPAAVEADLADAALYEDEAVKRLGEQAHGELRRLAHRDYRRQVLAERGGQRVAVVYATGEIVPGRGDPGFGGTPLAASETLAEALREIREDAGVRAVVLRIDSPGGSSTAADTIWREVALTREKKPVVVSMSDLAASGGYWIAAPASRLVAGPGTLTGSIGAWAGKFNLQGLYQWIGVRREILQRGDNADLFSDYRAFSPAQRVLLRRELEATYVEFIRRVASGRGMDPAAVKAVAEGRVWTGEQARARGLVDVLGGFDRALDEARNLAGIEPDRPLRLEFYPRERGLLESLLSSDLSRVASALQRLGAWLETLSRVLEQSGRIQAREASPPPRVR
jgi:protease-4